MEDPWHSWYAAFLQKLLLHKNYTHGKMHIFWQKNRIRSHITEKLSYRKNAKKSKSPRLTKRIHKKSIANLG